MTVKGQEQTNKQTITKEREEIWVTVVGTRMKTLLEATRKMRQAAKRKKAGRKDRPCKQTNKTQQKREKIRAISQEQNWDEEATG